MIRTLAVAAALTATPALADSMSATHSGASTTTASATYGTTVPSIDGGIEAATARTTVTQTSAPNYSATSTSTSVSTATYDRYFDPSGNPTYMPDVSFSLD